MKNLQAAMRRMPTLFIFGLFAFLATMTVSFNEAVSVKAQTSQRTIKGGWTAEFDRSKPNKIYLTFSRHPGKGGFNISSNVVPLTELQGLAADALTATKTNVNFNIVREAGTISCEGYFSDGKGTGFWILIPNKEFVSSMRSRGYDNLTEDDLLSAAMSNLTTKFIEDLDTAGYDHLLFEQLRRASTHDITPGFINQMKSAGFKNLSIEDLIRLKNHDVTLAFVSEIKAEGYKDIPAETAIRLKSHDVDGNFIRRAKSQGYDVPLDEIIKLRNRGTVK